MMTMSEGGRRAWLLPAMLALSGIEGCSVAHEGPRGGTETGNPPVIDATRVRLLARASEVKVAGSKGAVTPGGSTVNLLSLVSAASESVRSERNGSFEFQLSASPGDTYELRPADANGDTSGTLPVYVLPGSKVVSAQGLSCTERAVFANNHVASAGRDISCERDSDCQWQHMNTACTDSCYQAPVSALGASQIEDARRSADTGVCKHFEEDGCTILLLPCSPPASSVLRCVSGTCQGMPDMQSAPGEAPAEQMETRTGCSEAFDPGTGDVSRTRYWYSAEAQACLKRNYNGIGGNANQYETLSACEAACKPPSPDCIAPRVSASVCLEGGATGGCALRGVACALPCTACTPPCTSAGQCASDPIGTWCASGYCDATSPR